MKRISLKDPILNRRSPDSIFIAGALMTSGLSMILFNEAVGSVDRLVGTKGGIVWAVAMLIGGVSTLTGIAWKDADTGLLVERGGRYFLCSACFGYCVALWSFTGRAGLFPIAVMASLGLASGLRAIHISMWLKEARKTSGNA